MCFTQLIDRFVILGKSSPTSEMDIVFTQPSATEGCQVRGSNVTPSEEPAQGSFLPTHSPDLVRTSRYWLAKSLPSPVWTWRTSVTHRLFLLGKFSKICQDCFCSLRCSVSELQRSSQNIASRLRRKLLFSLHICSNYHCFFFCIQHISSVPLTLSCQSSAPISISYLSQCFWHLILILLPQSLSQLCHGFQVAIHLYHYKIYTRLWKQTLFV